MSKPVVTRFAPSPTGYLHIGGARTALFNWLYARANGGTFLLRIEDTDRARSTPEATEALIKGLDWLGLDWDGDTISQFANAERHTAIANEMLNNGTAYKCFSTPEEIEAWRAENNGYFPSPWRDTDPSDHPEAAYAIRLRAPRDGRISIADKVQGQVSWDAEQFDDLILLRSDGTPTYMLAVVVDDHDMGITHVIRGDDHLINAGRQSLIYQAMGWELPEFAHIPLIHGEDGKKLSKRHGATGIHEYAALGYMPEAMRNYLARLGWSHGNDELFTTEQAISWFGFDGMGKAPARLDFKKLDSVSAHHIKEAASGDLLGDLLTFAHEIGEPIHRDKQGSIEDALAIARERSKRLGDVLHNCTFVLAERPIEFDEKAKEILNSVSIGILKELTPRLEGASWAQSEIDAAARAYAEEKNIGLGKIGMPLKAALSGRGNAPSGFGMAAVLGRDETLARIADVVASGA